MQIGWLFRHFADKQTSDSQHPPIEGINTLLDATRNLRWWDLNWWWFFDNQVSCSANLVSVRSNMPLCERPPKKKVGCDESPRIWTTIKTTNNYSTSSTARGGGRSFKNRKVTERWVVVTHGWQSEPTDGPKGGWGSEFLSLSLSLSSFSLCLSISVSVSLCLCLCLSDSISHLLFSLCLRVSVSVSLFLSLSLSLSS